jgi:PBP1b-binding outer membrane lipoprotein LpoB
MKAYLIILLSSLILTGCFETAQVKQERVVVKQYEFVVSIPPAELLTPPTQVAPIDIDSAKQSDAAKWILDNEERMRGFEDRLIGISKFFVNEQDKAKKEADSKNLAARQAAGISDAEFATKVINTPIKK